MISELFSSAERIAGFEASKLIEKKLSQIIRSSCFYKSHDSELVKSWVETVEDEECLRSELSKMKLIAFIADGSILPRASGTDDRPLSGKAQKIIPFSTPENVKISLKRLQVLYLLSFNQFSLTAWTIYIFFRY